MADSPTPKEQMLPPALPAGLAHLASLWAPVIRDAAKAGGDADRPLQRPPLVQVALGTPLPQFPVPLHLEVELARGASASASDVVSDTDETRRLVDSSDSEPTRKIVDRSDTEPTLKRPSLGSKRALELVMDVSDAEATRRRPMSSAPPPMTIEATSELGDLDLQEIHAPEELAELAMLSRLEDLDELTADSTRQLDALRRQQRVRRSASRVVGALLAVGAIVLGFAIVRVGQAAASRADASSVITFSVARLGFGTAVEAAPRRVPPETIEAAPEQLAQIEPIELDAARPSTASATPTALPVAQVATSKPPSAKPAVKTASKIAGDLTKALAPKAPPASATTGFLDTGSEAKGHRVFVDGYVAGYAPSSIKLQCGAHSVRVGSAGKLQKVDVPCGGRVFVLSLAPQLVKQPPVKQPAKPAAKPAAKPTPKKK